MLRDLARITPGSRGWWPNQSPFGVVPDTIISGSNVIPRGPGRLTGFPGYGAASGLAAATMMPVKDTSGGIGTGSVIYHRGDTYWWIGSGTAVVGSTSLGAATSALQLKVGLGGAALTAGLSTPAQPTLATNGAGNMSGTYSVKIAWKRSTTGAVSNASVASAVVSMSSNRLQLTLPAVPSGVDRVIVYSSKRGFGASGPWYFLAEHPVAPTTITALGPNANGQWADGDLASDLAPFENDPPPSGTHCTTLGNLMVVLGCYGGAGVAFSFPARPEAFSPNRVFFLPGPVTGLQPRAADGFVYVWGTNYLAALVLVPGGLVVPRIIWATLGFPNPDAACLVETELWGYTSEPVRTTQSGDPDTSFGLPVRDYMRANWTPANVVVGYSPEWNAVVYFHQSEAVAYFRGADAWSTPLTGTSSVQAAVTVGGELRVASGGALVRFGAGGGTTGSAVTNFYEVNGGRRVTIRRLRTAAVGTVTADLLANLNQSTVEATQALSGATDYHGDWLSPNVLNATSFAMKYTGSGTWAVYETHVRGVPREEVR